jgi:hypothetical protein
VKLVFSSIFWSFWFESFLPVLQTFPLGTPGDKNCKFHLLQVHAVQEFHL